MQMLLILIPIIWFSLAVLVVLLCRMAARGDEALAQTAEQRPAPLPTVTLPVRARWREMPYAAGSHSTRTWAPRGRAQRAREGRCVTGS